MARHDAGEGNRDSSQASTNPYAAPASGAVATLARSASDLYREKPLHRRSGPLSALLFVGLFTGFVAPLAVGSASPLAGWLIGTLGGLPILAVSALVLTGPVYNRTMDRPGELTTWGVGNKVVAALILGGWLWGIVALILD